jgi:hypothetical protein
MLRNKSQQTKLKFIMLPNEDDVEITAGSVGTKMNAMPCTGPEDCLDMFVIPVAMPMSGCT